MTAASESRPLKAKVVIKKDVLKVRHLSTKKIRNTFWVLAHEVSKLSEGERMIRISSGFDPNWLIATRDVFFLQKKDIAGLAHISTATLDRRLKSDQPLDPVASERLDRLAQLAVMAEDVFEDKQVATDWLSKANDALGGKTPIALCETELGARQVRRVLHAIEWGGVA